MNFAVINNKLKEVGNFLSAHFNPSQEHTKEWAKYIFFLNELFLIGFVLGNIGPIFEVFQFIKGNDKYSLILKHFVNFIVLPLIVYGLVKGLDRIIKVQDNYLLGIIWMGFILYIFSVTYARHLDLILFVK